MCTCVLEQGVTRGLPRVCVSAPVCHTWVCGSGWCPRVCAHECVLECITAGRAACPGPAHHVPARYWPCGASGGGTDNEGVCFPGEAGQGRDTLPSHPQERITAQKMKIRPSAALWVQNRVPLETSEAAQCRWIFGSVVCLAFAPDG